MTRKVLGSFYRRDSGELELNSLVVMRPYGEDDYSLEYWDVDHSKSYGYIFHMSGGGGSLPVSVDGPYWRSPGFTVREKATQLCRVGEDGKIDKAETRYLRMRNRTRRLTNLPAEFRGGIDLLDWLECHGIQDETVYCSTCEDHLPSESLCEHCWWCDTVGWYVTPSEGSPCDDEDCWDCSKHGPLRLKVEGNLVTTNRSHRVDIDEARRALPWLLRHAGEVAYAVADAPEINGYGVRRLTKEGFSVGCAVVTWSELQRLADTLGIRP